MGLRASAPGKLVLFGEYAVLHGHPAVVMAANRRAVVRMEASGAAEWTVEAPGFEDRLAAFHFDGGHRFCWCGDDSDAALRLGLVEKIAGGLVDSGILDPRLLKPAKVTLDTRAFFQRTESASRKLGLGSSAALSVALAEALRMWAVEASRSDAFPLGELLDLHRSFQGGTGSGVDVAASRNGGVLKYRLIGGGRRPIAEVMVLPDDLEMVFVWTGRSASTASFLSVLDAQLETDNGAIIGVLEELGALSAVGISHLQEGATAVFLQTINEFGAAMKCLGDAASIPILSAEHIALRRMAEDFPVEYKPSGAGGGDVGIAFADDPEAAAAFRTKVEGEGFASLDLKIDPRGVATEFTIHDSSFTIDLPC